MIAPESRRSAAAAHTSETKLMCFVVSVNCEILLIWKLSLKVEQGLHRDEARGSRFVSEVWRIKMKMKSVGVGEF